MIRPPIKYLHVQNKKEQTKSMKRRLIQSIVSGIGTGAMGVVLIMVLHMFNVISPSLTVIVFAFGVSFTITFLYRLFNLEE